MSIKDLPSDVREAASAIAGNWKRFDSFAWFGRHAIEDAGQDPSDFAIVYLSNRDSGYLDKSNEASILATLNEVEPEGWIGDGASWWTESHSHWGVGHVDGIVIRVRDATGEPTKTFVALHECAMALADYPVLDDEDLSQREYEDECEIIEDPEGARAALHLETML